MTTIVDVEKKSGVSRSTISRFLNGKSVRPENKRKIEQAIDELSFKRNFMASGLKTSKTYTVGCVIPEITDPFFPGIIKVFQGEMLKMGYQTIINTYGNDTGLEVEQVRALANKRVDGLVVATSKNDGSHIQDCLDGGLPVIMVDRIIEGLNCDSVTVDNYQSVYDAISLAIRKGHKKIGYIRGQDLYTDVIRFRGYKDALERHGIDIPDDYVVIADVIEHDSTRQFMRLMNLSDPPTLIFCSNVYHTMGAVEAMLEYNLNIPQDVSIMVFDLLSSFPYYGFTSCFKPQFASIVQPLEKIGLNTAELLLSRLEKGMKSYAPVNVELKTIFNMTESVSDLF
ncbi:MAG: LacI family DNA-binding transcriptional regulator [Chloroflexota bacterium]|nr:LacI family DNA-binding transcriptional regulator [Chloroflexota bacterium]